MDQEKRRISWRITILSKKLAFTVTVRYVCNDEQEEIIESRVEQVKEELGYILEARLGDGVGMGLIEYEVEDEN